jgi:thiol:disulfide interchange protein DsbC
MIETDSGIFFVSENGRFAFKGTMLDMWNGKPIRTIEDVDKIVNHINLKKIGVDFKELFVLTYGHGPKEEVFFVSPGCPHCHHMLDQMKGLENEYTFKIIPLPILGPRSVDAARRLMCLGDNDKAVKALMEKKYKELPEGKCKMTPLQKGFVVAQVLGIRGVPYIVRHDGYVQRGAVKNLKKFLKEGDQNAG